MKLVRFTVAGDRWSVPIDAVVGVRAADEVRALPDPHERVVGVIDHDGEVHPVLGALGTDGRHVLLVHAGDRMVGVLVGHADGILDVDDVRPAPPGQRRALVSAVAGTGAELLYILDPQELADELPVPKEMVP